VGRQGSSLSANLTSALLAVYSGSPPVEQMLRDLALFNLAIDSKLQ